MLVHMICKDNQIKIHKGQMKHSNHQHFPAPSVAEHKLEIEPTLFFCLHDVFNVSSDDDWLKQSPPPLLIFTSLFALPRRGDSRCLRLLPIPQLLPTI